MINKFKRVFITFDFDAERDVKASLAKIGLNDGSDYLSIGVNKPGCEFIEGLLPERIRAAVHAQNVDDVNAMMSQDNAVRKSARQRLKKAYLEEFAKTKPEESELALFKSLFSKIAHAF